MSDHLSPGEQEKLDQFQIITSYKDADYDKVVQLLRNNYWNLEVALSKYFDNGLEDETPMIPPQLSTSNVHGLFSSELFEDRPLENLQQSFEGLGVFPSLVKVSPISNSWKSLPGLIKKPNHSLSFTESPILFLLLIIPRTITLLFLKLATLWDYLFPSQPNRTPSEPTLEKFDFETYFHQLTKDSIGQDVKLSQQDFNETLRLCNEDNKLLLLILIKDDDEETSSNFIKTILNHPSVKQLLNQESIIEQNMVCFFGSVNEPQGLAIAQSLRIKTLPVCFLIGNAGSGASVNSSMSLLSRIPLKTFNLFKSRLSREIERFKPELTLRRLEQSELDYSRELKQVQDNAYQESLRKDRQKKKQAEKEQIKKDILQGELASKETNRKNFLRKLYDDFNNRQLDSFGSDEITAIRIKLPHGVSITEKVCRTDTLLDLYSIIQLKIHLHEMSDEQKDEFAETEPVPIDGDYKHEFKFDLVSPFPRISIARDSDTLIRDVSELWPNGSILVELNNSDEDDSD